MLSDELSIRKCFHKEYGGYVYQICGYRSWVEPFVTEREAKAFIQGASYAEMELKNEPKTKKGAPIDYAFISPEGKQYSGHNIREFCRAHGLEPSCMIRVNSGERRQHKGWKADDSWAT